MNIFSENAVVFSDGEYGGGSVILTLPRHGDQRYEHAFQSAWSRWTIVTSDDCNNNENNNGDDNNCNKLAYLARTVERMSRAANSETGTGGVRYVKWEIGGTVQSENVPSVINCSSTGVAVPGHVIVLSGGKNETREKITGAQSGKINGPSEIESDFRAGRCFERAKERFPVKFG